MMFGNIGDNKRTLKEAVDFLLKYDDFAQMRTIRPVTPYPGSPLYYDAIDKGLIKDVADFYENKHVNSDLLAANFTELSDEEFYESLTQANTALLTNYYDTAKKEALKHFPANGEASLSGVVVECDISNGLAKNIESFIFGGSLKNIY